MRTRKIALIAISAITIAVVGGCSTNAAKNGISNTTAEAGSGGSQDGKKVSEVRNEVKVETASKEQATEIAGEQGVQEPQKESNPQAIADIPMVKLPEGIKGIKSETAPNKELSSLIIKDMDIPEDYFETTHYSYNYVDLNDDGTEEIFAVISGPYTSGTGGSTGILVSNKAGKLHIEQDFTLINTPVIISDKKENGFHELIVPYYGNEKSQYSVLSYKDGAYNNVPDGRMIDSLDKVTGKAILANDIIKESEAGYLGISLTAE